MKSLLLPLLAALSLPTAVEANTKNVYAYLNIAEANFEWGNNEAGCYNISMAIAIINQPDIWGETSNHAKDKAKKAKKKWADECNFKF